MIKAVLFDLDNTLLDFLRMKNTSVDAAVSAMIDAGLPMEKNKALKMLWELYDDYGIEYGEIMQKFLKKTLGEIDYRMLARGIIAYRRVKSSFLEPYPHVVPTLIRLKERGYKLAVVSDAPRMRAWLRLASMKITDFFDVVVTMDDSNGKLKPDPLPYTIAMKKLGMKPEQSVFVGDNTNRDITGAKKLGMVTVLAKYGEWSKPGKNAKMPDYSIKDISELLKILEKI
ncbi:MAG: TIGR02253 family HAD-type hydrolase [Candidatus Aenigmarchaeota archaeon]|nr:TIGR02253 family HAD-type hydrolase [Candidatus Aenigmarchaeota archaeon]